jgi:hypothetical protein
MESHGIKGRIQVSQSTADEIVKAGKRGWIVPREDKIQAKGKGELQTYFVNERFMKVRVDKSTASPRTSEDGDFFENERDCIDREIMMESGERRYHFPVTAVED